MGLINTTEQSYYEGNDFGGYQFISLKDIVNNFMLSYVGEEKIIPKIKRNNVSFFAQRALQELSYDTFRSEKSQEIDIPPSLTMSLPQDYVQYVKLTWVDTGGVEHVLYPAIKTSNPNALLQDSNYNYIPKNYEVPADATYIHCTSNNTIFGTQMKEFPKTDKLLVCDMSSDIFSVDENDSLDLVINIMKWKKFNHMPVINNEKELVGLLSSTDMEKYISNSHNGRRTISGIMQKTIVTINQYSSAKDAKKLMKKHNINSLPVVEKNRLIGIVTSKDV